MPGNPFYQSQEWRELREACLKRDGYRCTVPGCRKRGTFADHIETRPRVPYRTQQDALGNLRSLCATHDAQVKERFGQRKQSGEFKVIGCDADGWPNDPTRRR